MLPRSAAALIVLLSAGFSSAARARDAAPVAPATAQISASRAVCQPTFRVDDQRRTTGTAFLLRSRAEGVSVLALTAHHLLGLRTGQLAWDQVPAHANGGTCKRLDGSELIALGRAFSVRGAHMLGELATLNDIAVFALAAAPKSPVLDLADQEPRLGQRVWLIARLKAQSSNVDFAHAARVVSGAGYLGFTFDELDLDLSNTSGAPIVDDTGAVVGVNVGAGRLASGRTMGVADSLPTIRAAVSGALAQSGLATSGLPTR